MSERPNAYLRMIENRWVTTEDNFIDMAWWDECTDATRRPVLEDRGTDVYLGIDASTKRDSTAVVAAAYDRPSKTVQLVAHRVFQPDPDDPLDFEHTVEATVAEFADRFRVREARYDPYQMVASAQRLSARGINMVEFPQTSANLTEASSNLYELIKGRNLRLYPDDAMRLAASRCVAVESSRGWRIAKEKASHKIDVIVALAQAALGAVGAAAKKPPMLVDPGVLARSAWIGRRGFAATDDHRRIAAVSATSLAARPVTLMATTVLTTDAPDPAVPSRRPRIGDGPPDAAALAQYRALYPGRSGTATDISNVTADSRYGWGDDMGYRYSHKVT